MVLLGRRRSIGSILRSTILDASAENVVAGRKLGLNDVAKGLANLQSAPCYLVLCNGADVVTIEKDFRSGKIRSSKDFMVHTNHDVDHSTGLKPEDYANSSALGHEEWLEESTTRRERFEAKWTRHQQKSQAKVLQDNTCTKSLPHPNATPGTSIVYPVDESTLKRWVRSRTTMANCTHFACLMDPRSCQIRWIQRGPIAQEEQVHEQT